MVGRFGAVIAVFLSASPAVIPARAGPEADRAAIVGRLNGWTAAFNAHDSAGVCNLFAPDLVSVTPGRIAGDRASLCERLDALLVRPGLQLHYDNPDIREIIVSGDIAVVRLVWTLTTRRGNEQDVAIEAGIDVFQRQPDGRWSIARFASFTNTPSKFLP